MYLGRTRCGDSCRDVTFQINEVSRATASFWAMSVSKYARARFGREVGSAVGSKSPSLTDDSFLFAETVVRVQGDRLMSVCRGSSRPHESVMAFLCSFAEVSRKLYLFEKCYNFFTLYLCLLTLCHVFIFCFCMKLLWLVISRCVVTATSIVWFILSFLAESKMS